MKSTLLNALLLILFLSSLSISQPVRTRSMDSTMVAELKIALNADPLLIEIKSYAVTENEDFPEGGLGVESTHFKFNKYRKDVFDYVFKNQPLIPETKRDILKLAVSDSIETYFKNPNNSNGDNAYGRALSLGYFLEHYAFITDMLWHYSDQAYVASLKDSLAVITAFADSVLRVSEPYGNPASHPPYFPDWPRTEYHNIRLRLIGAFGYAGCVLDSGRYVAYADSMIFS